MCLTKAYQALGYDNDSSKHLIHKQTQALFLRYLMVRARSLLRAQPVADLWPASVQSKAGMLTSNAYHIGNIKAFVLI